MSTSYNIFPRRSAQLSFPVSNQPRRAQSIMEPIPTARKEPAPCCQNMDTLVHSRVKFRRKPLTKTVEELLTRLVALDPLDFKRERLQRVSAHSKPPQRCASVQVLSSMLDNRILSAELPFAHQLPCNSDLDAAEDAKDLIAALCQNIQVIVPQRVYIHNAKCNVAQKTNSLLWHAG